MTTYTLTLPDTQISEILQALAQRPWATVNPIMVAIDTQINAQNVPQAPVPHDAA